jgi:hypothetical protein
VVPKSLAIVFCAIMAIGLLNAFGFCFQRFWLVSNREIVEQTILALSPRMADFPSNAQNPARAFLDAHPGCCYVTREDPRDASFLDNLSGSKIAMVRLTFEMTAKEVARAPSEGKFYDAYVQVGSCCRVVRVTGMIVHGAARS